MTTTWIIAADSSRARILQVTDRDEHLEEIEDLLNPEGRVHDRELVSDAHPRFSGHGGVGKPSAHSTGGPGSDRVLAQTEACAAICVSLNGQTIGSMQTSFTAVDDSGRTVTFSSPRASLPPPQ